MNKIITSMLAIAFLAVALSTQAQTNKVTFTLKVIEQYTNYDTGTLSVTKVASRSINTQNLMGALEDDFSTTFPTGSYLAYDNGLGGLVVIDPAHNKTDVSSVFSININDGVYASSYSDSTGAGSETDYNVITFSYEGPVTGLEFSISGLATSTFTQSAPNSSTGAVTTSQGSAVTSLVGTGTAPNGDPIVITGTAAEAKTSITQ